ncbi:hypothetical protein BD410DRAFT_822996 [Rickenella mellea]|uniref:F-box domain-containing protein n=1 Tax=Rickenella mellea TaxID=50990 RepID=A0A4Y7PMF7_9AGAM|nr:hypothetical protein BD410DRAFT_822996 [Rickenella mellea]
MHRVLTIPELLDIIFCSTDELANARSVSVCKTWSGVALDTLWRDVHGLPRLFSLLAPVRRSSFYGFQRSIEPSDWTRFNAVAHRVKYLTVEDLNGDVFCEEDLGEVSTTRQTFHILPHLIQLTLNTRNEDEFWFSVIFLHQNLQRLVLKIPDKVVPKRFFAEVSLRSAKLCYLDLRMTIPVRTVEAELTDMLSTLTDLKTVVMPRYTISSSVMSSLSRLPNLGTIQFEYFSYQGSGDPADVQPFCPVMREGAFPSLWDLSCYSTLCDMSSFFMAKYAPVNITSLYVHTLSIETPLSFSECLTALSQTCQMLKYLGLYLILDGSAQIQVEDSYNLSFKDLCPILDFPHLTTFDLTHYRPLDITDDDMDRLARNWPSLESLKLNAEPVILDNPKITFASLSSLAQHCPNLTRLGLYLNPSPHDLPKPGMPFKMLKSLEFGTSPIQSEDHAALYLSEICPLSCTVEVGVTWTDELKSGIIDNEDVADGEMRRRWECWEQVRDILPLLIKLRREERERSQDLEREVHDLRMRVQILEDFRALPGSPGCIYG